MTRPFSIAQKLRILVQHGAKVVERGKLKPLHLLFWISPTATKRWTQLKNLPVAVQCACRGELSPACNGTQWLPLAIVEFDHHLAHTFGGETHQRNGRPLAPACHAVKSARETIAVRKVGRIKAKHEGERKPHRKWPTRKLSGRTSWPKRTFNTRNQQHAQA